MYLYHHTYLTFGHNALHLDKSLNIHDIENKLDNDGLLWL